LSRQIGCRTEFDKTWVLDLANLRNFLEATQPETARALDLRNDSPMRRQLLARLNGEMAQCGVVDVLGEGDRALPRSPKAAE
jgi:type I restriction enzyme R subunit